MRDGSRSNRNRTLRVADTSMTGHADRVAVVGVNRNRIRVTYVTVDRRRGRRISVAKRLAGCAGVYILVVDADYVCSVSRRT